MHRISRRRPRSDDAGFTLAETVVSFAIFALVSAAAAVSLTTGIQTENNTADRVAAAQLAQQSTDEARSMPRSRLVALVDTPTTSAEQRVGGKTFSVTRTVSFPGSECLPPAAVPTVDDTSVRTIAVRVEVRTPGSSNRVVAMNSVIAC